MDATDNFGGPRYDRDSKLEGRMGTNGHANLLLRSRRELIALMQRSEKDTEIR